MINATTHRFDGHGVQLVGDCWDPVGTQGRKATVLLMHGGGQTRHSWRHTGRLLAARGWRAVAVDARGHGDSDWAPGADYSHEVMVADVVTVARALDEELILVGASMGGLAALFAQAENADLGRALVLVDVTPRLEADGVGEITDFMRRGLTGFDSLEDAAAAIVAHTPDRRRSTRPEGLKRNLREVDGRWFWHWDPEFLDRAQGEGQPGTQSFADRAHAAARAITVPTMLVRGANSRVVSDAGVRELLDALPGARYVDVLGTGHMVAGDDNDVFTAALLQFIDDEFGA